MVRWPALGTRVTLRYRRPPGSVPPLTDAVGHLLAIEPTVRVQTKSGVLVEVKPADVTALRVLTPTPTRTADIRNLEYAAAAACPGAEQTWLHGWLLRAHGATLVANSAVPLDISAKSTSIPAIVDWYTSRGLTPRLAIPDRLLAPPVGPACEHTEQVLVRDLEMVGPLDMAGRPDAHAVGATATDAPDGTRWLGLPAEFPRGRCDALLAWGAEHGATRAYWCVPETDPTTDSIAPAESLGFRLHHRRRYVLPL